MQFLFSMNFYKALLITLLIPCYLSAQVFTDKTEEIEIGIIEKLDSIVPLDITLFSEDADTVQFKDILKGPTVLSLVYFRCPGICSPLMDGLADVIKKSDLIIGKDYRVITVSFNPLEGPSLAKQKKQNYISQSGLDKAVNGWEFYTSDSLNIALLTQSVGFKYITTGNDFQHAATLIFIDANGKITRYLNGTRFLPFEFKMALIETAKGESGPTINKVLQYCFSFDAKGKGYVLNVTRISGVLIIVLLLIVFLSLTTRKIIKKLK